MAGSRSQSNSLFEFLATLPNSNQDDVAYKGENTYKRKFKVLPYAGNETYV